MLRPLLSLLNIQAAKWYDRLRHLLPLRHRKETVFRSPIGYGVDKFHHTRGSSTRPSPAERPTVGSVKWRCDDGRTRRMRTASGPGSLAEYDKRMSSHLRLLAIGAVGEKPVRWPI
jgi:hypothetical protein